MMYRADKLLRGFDEDCRAQVTDDLGKRGVKVSTGSLVIVLAG
jgi:NADH dehydrogenase FAD-containing subunit